MKGGVIDQTAHIGGSPLAAHDARGALPGVVHVENRGKLPPFLGFEGGHGRLRPLSAHIDAGRGRAGPIKGGGPKTGRAVCVPKIEIWFAAPGRQGFELRIQRGGALGVHQDLHRHRLVSLAYRNGMNAPGHIHHLPGVRQVERSPANQRSFIRFLLLCAFAHLLFPSKITI